MKIKIFVSVIPHLSHVRWCTIEKVMLPLKADQSVTAAADTVIQYPTADESCCTWIASSEYCKVHLKSVGFSV